MNNQQSNSGAGSFAYGFITGGLIIGSLALLFAPKKGSRLRKDLRHDIFKAKKELAAQTENYLNSAGDFLNTAKEKAEDFIAEGSHKITHLLDSSESKIVEGADALISQGKNKVSKLLDESKGKDKSKNYSHHNK